MVVVVIRMKIKLSELHPNPFKKSINDGKLNRGQIDSIKANLKKLGFMGSLPVFKKDKEFYLISGHHRLQALKEVYGKDFQAEIIVHDYDEDQVFRGMVIENLTQRGQQFAETSENVQSVETYLTDRPEVLKELRGESNRGDSPRLKGGEWENKVSANDIAEWLDGNKGTVMKKDEISPIDQRF